MFTLYIHMNLFLQKSKYIITNGMINSNTNAIFENKINKNLDLDTYAC